MIDLKKIQQEKQINELINFSIINLDKPANPTSFDIDQIIKKGYSILGLETFFTIGPKEVRAWTIKKGSTAPQAAGRIHTDFERGFISAQVVGYDDLNKFGSEKVAKTRGLVRLEGKTYIMRDGDVVEFNFSV